MNPLPITFHAGAVHLPVAGGGGGSPLYDLPADHLPALALLTLLPLAAAVIAIASPRVPLAARLREGYRARPPLHRLAAWLLAASGVIHLGLIGHHDGLLGVLMILDGVVLLGVVGLLLTGRRWRPAAAVVLLGSLVGWWVVTLSGGVPDQVGVLTKLAELGALAIVATPTSSGRMRGWLGSALIVGLVVVTDAAAWAGAFGGATGGHHAGGVPEPGTFLASGGDREPTPDETVAADAVWRATVAALRPYADPAVAAARGYAVDGLFGLDFHASNAAFGEDGRIVDPARPENLIYAAGPHGPVLLGAMFEMPSGAASGPAFGGPLTVWHAHEQVCFGLLPLGMTGLVSPLGGCPIGSFDIARTPQMIHVWVAHGAPVHWGELDEAWKAAYVAAVR